MTEAAQSGSPGAEEPLRDAFVPPDARAPAAAAGGWIPRRTADGSWTCVDPVHGEACHSLAGAWTQARERYAREARVAERARARAAAGDATLRLLDVGTGLGLNLAAALEAVAGSGVALDALSLERDPAILARALEGPREPDDLERWHAPVRAALARALAEPERAATCGVPLAEGRLRLRVGDARATLAGVDGSERFHAVFLDPFSPRVAPELWERAFLGEIAARMAPEAILATYSAATAVRAALLAAGLAIGRGARVGGKREGTLASLAGELPPLEPRAARRARARADTAGTGFRLPAETPDPSIH